MSNALKKGLHSRVIHIKRVPNLRIMHIKRVPNSCAVPLVGDERTHLAGELAAVTVRLVFKEGASRRKAHTAHVTLVT